MKTVTIFFLLNATLLLLHEIESAYEKEWEILKLPGEITGFLIMHIPIILLLMYGVIEINNYSLPGRVIGVITGTGGVIPFLVHKVFIKREDCFNRTLSGIIIYANIFTGIGTILLSLFNIN
jgi:hypothetical protein